VTPHDDATPAHTRTHPDLVMVEALARAHRWERMLQENRCVSIGGVW
jgi:hypothetical protein